VSKRYKLIEDLLNAIEEKRLLLLLPLGSIIRDLIFNKGIL
jgi:hypothetical protein